jgi:hypothetical protein
MQTEQVASSQSHRFFLCEIAFFRVCAELIGLAALKRYNWIPGYEADLIWRPASLRLLGILAIFYKWKT